MTNRNPQARRALLASAALSSTLLAFAAIGGARALAQEAATEVAVEAAAAETDPVARGDTPEAHKGYDISARSDRTDRGFGDSRVAAKMVLRNEAGQTSEREFTFATLEKENDNVGDKTLIVFVAPRFYDGTALLSHAKILDPDDQWLYLPATKRVKRISSDNKSGAFLGSEFSFEDFTTTELNKYTYKFIGEDEIDGMKMDVIERYPRYEKSGYTRQRAWVDQEIFQTRKVEFYDRKDELLKTLTLTEYREYDGVWRSHLFSMTNHQTGKGTDLAFGDYEFKTGLDANDFEQSILTRLR
ncbi:MAG: outer membrane lipoprotein-sorting protein [Alphaproteobacteria bacterium]|nr:outer membrane lipoprotein-sorting protein [Alphaproteobacteria bacterium]